MEEEFVYVENAHCPDCSFSGRYLECHSRQQPVALSGCAHVFQSQLLKQYAVYIRDEKEKLK
jgi:hypothetical protein